jgi:hypothetical protein
VTKPSDDKAIELFRQHLKFLRERREDAVAQIATSRELIEHSRALIVQIDEQINQIERELVGGRPRSEPRWRARARRQRRAPARITNKTGGCGFARRVEPQRPANVHHSLRQEYCLGRFAAGRAGARRSCVAGDERSDTYKATWTPSAR